MTRGGNSVKKKMTEFESSRPLYWVEKGENYKTYNETV